MQIIQSSRRKRFIQAVKKDLAERFLKFETFNGAFIYIPWGAGFFYYGWPWEANTETILYIVTQPQFGYNYGLITLGMVLIIWGVRKTFVNRVKQQAKLEMEVEKRKDAGVS